MSKRKFPYRYRLEQEAGNLVAAVIRPLRYKLAEAAGGLATGVQSAHVEAIDCPAEAATGKLRPNMTPVGWFSDRRRIPAHSGIQVTRFHVWQDLSASINSDVAPLHATIMFELSDEWYSSLSRPNGVIRIENLKGEEVTEAGLMIHQANFGLESSQLVLNRQLQFVMSPTPLYRKLSASETVQGIAYMKFWNRKVKIILPETDILLFH